MSWIDNLKDVETFNFNSTLINNTDEIIPNMVSNANENAGNGWYYAVVLALWLVIAIWIFRKDEDIRYDTLRTIFFSSGIMLIFSGGILLSQLVTSVLPTIWFGIIWFLSGIAVFNLKRRGR